MNDRERRIDAWLRETLGHDRWTREPASADASFRRYLRVRDGDGTWILMDAPPAHEDCRPFLAVRSLLEGAGLSVPAVRAADPEQGLALLGDLGRTHYLEALSAETAEALYADAFDALLAMQTRIPASAVPPYDERLVRAELALFPDWFLARHLGVDPAGPLGRVLESAFDRLAATFAAQPRVFVHRDYHSRNLMVLARGNPGILDFQDAVGGPVTYDLLSLLRDVYLRWPVERVAEWVARYHAAARARGLVDVDLAAFRRWFDLTGVQRHLKVAGIFARLWYRDRKRGYLDDIPLTLEYLLAEAAACPGLEALADALDRLDLPARTISRNAEVRAGATA